MNSERNALQFGNQADAYLEWAQHTGFAHFDGVLQSEDGKRIGLLVRWKTPEWELLKNLNVTMAGVYFGQQVASITVEQENLPHLLKAGLTIDFVELATPLAVADDSHGSHDLTEISTKPPTAEAPTVLFGCIDDGFPIASEQFHKAGLIGLVRFWNQQDVFLPTGKFLGIRKDDPDGTNFGYGRELKMQNLLTPAMAKVAGAGLTDAWYDVRYYQRMQLRRSLHRATHGAHVLDVLAGELPVRSRVSASRDMVNGEDGSATKPPSRKPDGSAAAQAPIVLVQLPAYALDDPSGRWLGRNVLDGLHYIVQTAKLWDNPQEEIAAVKKVVINLSWGPQTGPHDGTSLLEVAIDDLIEQESKRECSLEVSLPAGNSYEARAHAEFLVATGATLCWCVPPGARSPAFLEVWWPIGIKGDDALLTVAAPDGTTLSASKGPGIWSQAEDNKGAAANKIRWGITQIEHPGGFMALIALAPTFSHNPIDTQAPQKHDATAPHGEWHIEVGAVSGAEGTVHVYVARADHNMGTKRRAQTSYLRDATYELSRRSVKAEHIDTVPGSCIQKTGTLNGIGTGKATKMAAGYRLSDGMPAPYSSSGPTRGQRKAPDWAYPTEVSRMVHGIPGAGTRSGTVVHLSGTSAAAPQSARDLANEALPAATDANARAARPEPGDATQPEKPIDARMGAGKR